MRIPSDATPGVKQAIKEIWERLERFGVSSAQNVNAKGTRITNAGEAVQDGDYVTLGQLKKAMSTLAAELATETVEVTETDTGSGSEDCEFGEMTDSKPNFQSHVEAAKAYLEGLSVDLSGPCGAFEIIKEAVSRIRAVDSTVGFLEKLSGNNCNGYSVDIITFVDGTSYDVLIDAGDLNTPTWNLTGGCKSPDRYRPSADAPASFAAYQAPYVPPS